MSPSDPRVPPDLLAALRHRDVLLVTSRDAERTGTVPMGFALTPDGVVYLLTSAFSRKAQRWEVDPWVRLAVPGGGAALEGLARRVGPDTVDAPLAEILLDRFRDSGASTAEGLRQLLETGAHRLIRIEGLRRAD
jgi:hypothetical protein